MKRCPRCSRELIQVLDGETYRSSDGRTFTCGRFELRFVCSGCRKAPAYCDCEFQRTMIEDEQFLGVESEFVLEE